MRLNSDGPFFSVILPTFNRAERLAEAIKSALNQQIDDYEIIVVDDGSSDNTRQVVEAFVSFDSRVKYLYKENEERSIARNHGIKHATGRYVCFLDSDDRMYVNHLLVAYQLISREHFPEVAHLGYELVDDSGARLLAQNSFDRSFNNRLIKDNIAHGNAIFIRRDIAENVNFIPSRHATISEDWCLWLQLAARYQFVFDNTVTSAVVEHEHRSLNNIDPDKLIVSTETIVFHLKADEHFINAYGLRAARHFASHYTFVALILALNRGRRREAIHFLTKAFWCYPGIITQRRFLATVKHLLK